MSDKEHAVTVKDDGHDVHYQLDAKSPQAAKKIVEAIQQRRADREAREGGPAAGAEAGAPPLSTAERALAE
jgi:hypothetical protein